ncbi:hypothetical protein V8C86DRAFT_2544307, partial [Haematococcus lacustris]
RRAAAALEAIARGRFLSTCSDNRKRVLYCSWRRKREHVDTCTRPPNPARAHPLCSWRRQHATFCCRDPARVLLVGPSSQRQHGRRQLECVYGEEAWGCARGCTRRWRSFGRRLLVARAGRAEWLAALAFGGWQPGGARNRSTQRSARRQPAHAVQRHLPAALLIPGAPAAQKPPRHHHGARPAPKARGPAACPCWSRLHQRAAVEPSYPQCPRAAAPAPCCLAWPGQCCLGHSPATPLLSLDRVHSLWPNCPGCPGCCHCCGASDCL